MSNSTHARYWFPSLMGMLFILLLASCWIAYYFAERMVSGGGPGRTWELLTLLGLSLLNGLGAVLLLLRFRIGLFLILLANLVGVVIYAIVFGMPLTNLVGWLLVLVLLTRLVRINWAILR